MKLPPGALFPKDAAYIAGVTATTIRRWARRYGLGIKICGRWMIDAERLRHLLVGGGQ